VRPPPALHPDLRTLDSRWRRKHSREDHIMAAHRNQLGAYYNAKKPAGTADCFPQMQFTLLY
jgi:hypothetical protein